MVSGCFPHITYISLLLLFNFERRVRKIALYSDLIHSFDWKSAVEHDGGV